MIIYDTKNSDHGSEYYHPMVLWICINPHKPLSLSWPWVLKQWQVLITCTPSTHTQNVKVKIILTSLPHCYLQISEDNWKLQLFCSRIYALHLLCNVWRLGNILFLARCEEEMRGLFQNKYTSILSYLVDHRVAFPCKTNVASDVTWCRSMTSWRHMSCGAKGLACARRGRCVNAEAFTYWYCIHYPG